MPCHTIQRNQVAIGAMAHDLRALTDADMAAAGYRVLIHNGRVQTAVYRDEQGYSYTVAYGVITSSRSPERIAEFRNHLARAYSKQTILAAAQRNGWTVRQTGTNQFEVQR